MPSRSSVLDTPFKSAGFAVIRQDRQTIAYQTGQERIAQVQVQVQVNVLSKQGAVQLGYGRKKVQQDSKEMVKKSTSCLPPIEELKVHD
jgi:hypothetical protein